MKKEYSRFKEGQIEEVFGKLKKEEKVDLDNFLIYRKSRGLNAISKINDVRRGLLQLRDVAEKPLASLNYLEITNLISLIRNSPYGDYQKNEIITTLKSFLKWKVPDWSKLKLDEICLIKNPVSKTKITDKDLFSKDDIENMIKHETKMFWKAFLLVQYEAGLRTKEVRYLKWTDVQFNVDGDISEINIYATKTKKSRSVFVKEATFYLNKLREEQQNIDSKGIYIFHSKNNLNEPTDKYVVNKWFKRLSQRTLGRASWNYLLRHSRGNELYKLSKQGKMSKDLALDFMGHSKEMSKVYTHIKADEIKAMMKEQVYHLEDLPLKKRAEFEEQIKKQNIRIEDLEKQNKIIVKGMLELKNIFVNIK